MSSPAGIEITGTTDGRFGEVLTPEAVEFLGALHREFNVRRLELLEARKARYAELAGGGTLDFLTETKAVREDDSWKVAEPAPGLEDRRAEITGPTDQRAQLGCEGVARRPRGRQHPVVGEHGAGPAQPP